MGLQKLKRNSYIPTVTDRLLQKFVHLIYNVGQSEEKEHTVSAEKATYLKVALHVIAEYSDIVYNLYLKKTKQNKNI